MSMNVFITAKREVTFKKKNGQVGTDTQTQTFNACQTPTQVTYEIVGSADPKQAYIDWILTQGEDEQMPIFADDDIFGEHEPIGFEIYNVAKEHVEQFREWMASVEEEGFVVDIEVS